MCIDYHDLCMGLETAAQHIQMNCVAAQLRGNIAHADCKFISSGPPKLDKCLQFVQNDIKDKTY